MYDIVFILASTAAGLMIGSFLNVCISRIPENISIITPRSRCPFCSRTIKPYDNIPVLSFLLLGGKCRNCGGKISIRYPLVEILAAVITSVLAWKWKSDPAWLAASLAAAYLFIIISFVDFETFLIADIFSYSLIFLGLAASFFNPYFNAGALNKIAGSVIGAASGAFIVWSLSFFGKKIYKREAVGEGDIFLMAGIGALTGWNGVISTLIISSFAGSLYGLSLMAFKKLKRFEHIPFGPFLSLGAVINLHTLIKVEYFYF